MKSKSLQQPSRDMVPVRILLKDRLGKSEEHTIYAKYGENLLDAISRNFDVTLKTGSMGTWITSIRGKGIAISEDLRGGLQGYVNGTLPYTILNSSPFFLGFTNIAVTSSFELRMQYDPYTMDIKQPVSLMLKAKVYSLLKEFTGSRADNMLLECSSCSAPLDKSLRDSIKLVVGSHEMMFFSVRPPASDESISTAVASICCSSLPVYVPEPKIRQLEFGGVPEMRAPVSHMQMPERELAPQLEPELERGQASPVGHFNANTGFEAPRMQEQAEQPKSVRISGLANKLKKDIVGIGAITAPPIKAALHTLKSKQMESATVEKKPVKKQPLMKVHTQPVLIKAAVQAQAVQKIRKTQAQPEIKIEAPARGKKKPNKKRPLPAPAEPKAQLANCKQGKTVKEKQLPQKNEPRQQKRTRKKASKRKKDIATVMFRMDRSKKVRLKRVQAKRGLWLHLRALAKRMLRLS